MIYKVHFLDGPADGLDMEWDDPMAMRLVYFGEGRDIPYAYQMDHQIGKHLYYEYDGLAVEEDLEKKEKA